MANTLSFLNSNKASSPNSIPYGILFLPKNEILKQLADLFNLFFMAGLFFSVLKTATVVPVFRKDSKLDYEVTIAQSLCYQILKKYLESLHMRDFILS